MNSTGPQYILFRTDAALHIGTGHVMRCLTLANALKAQGMASVFVCREHEGHLADEIQRQGHECLLLPKPSASIQKKPDAGRVPPHQGWLGESWQQDVAQTQAAIGRRQFDWLVVDHYALDACWETAMQPVAHRLLVIDDLADRAHTCSVLLDQTLGRQPGDYAGLVPASCRVLAGAEYALLRPEFARWRDYSLGRRQPPVLQQLLVNMGGTDPANITGQVLAVLARSVLPPGLQITVVLGLSAPHAEAVRRQAALMPVPTTVLDRVDNMAEVMSMSDLAIGAAGATSWERCCLGLPSVIVALAENQQLIGRVLQESGAALLTDPASWDAAGIIDRFVTDPDMLGKVSRSAADLVDGNGAARVTACLEGCK